MDKNKDAYGQELMAFLKGEKSYEIIERDDSFIDISSNAPEFYFSDYKKWPYIQKEAIKRTKGKVLDIGAGAGRVALYLQKKKFDVVSIDNSPLAIEVCKKRGVKKAKVVAIENIDYFKGSSFDTVLMLGNNFGLFGDFKKAKRLLKKIHKITSTDALIIAETTDPYGTKDPNHLDYHKRNKKKGRMSGQARIRVRFKKYVGGWFDYLLASKKEVKEIVKDTGWRVKDFIDSKETPQYIVVLEKENYK